MAQDLTAISTPGTTTQGPAFKAWFRNSVVRNPDGSPRPVYHGSTHSFEAFSLKPGNPENWYGKALYFTDSPEDVGRNYATPDSPDLRARIDKRTEQLMDRLVDELEQELGEALNWNDPRKDRLFQDAKSQATKELMGPGAISYKLYLRIERPVVIRQGGGTYFEIDYNERTGRETGSGMRLYRAVMKAAGQLNLPNSDEIWRQSVSADEGMTEGFTAQQFDENLRHSDAMMEARDWDATNEGEFLSLVYRLAGYDGIIMEDAGATFHNMGIPPGTRHYIIWNPRQAKSAIGNTGTWSTRTPRLTAGWEEDEGDYGVEDYPQCLGDYEFRTTCVSEGTGEHIQEMLDNAKDCGYSEVKRHCEGLRPWEKENGYAPDGSRKGLTLRHDWAVRYGRGTYRRMPCYFVVWSGIEHVWTRKGAGGQEGWEDWAGRTSSKGAGKSAGKPGKAGLLYHGTTKANLPSIMSEGLKPTVGRYAELWHGRDHNDTSKSNNLAPVVFAAPREHLDDCLLAIFAALSKDFPRTSTEQFFDNAVLLELPADQFTRNRWKRPPRNMKHVESRDYYSTSPVRPIRAITGEELRGFAGYAYQSARQEWFGAYDPESPGRRLAAGKEWPPWIGVDLDGTLAEEQSPFDPLTIGRPVPEMVRKVRQALEDGVEVRVFTARLADKGLRDRIKQAIRDYTREHVGRELDSTNEKDPGLREIWDDKARRVRKDEGTFALRGTERQPSRADRYLREMWSPGDGAWFEYHCWEDPKSCDANLWYHSHQRVTVLGKADADGWHKGWDGSMMKDRAEAGAPRAYTVRFQDGYERTAGEDELMTSRRGFYRPDPPRPPKAFALRGSIIVEEPLYHVTFRKNLRRILREGLRGDQEPNWPFDSSPGNVYLMTRDGLDFWMDRYEDLLREMGSRSKLVVLEVSPKGLMFQEDIQGTEDSGTEAYRTGFVPPGNIHANWRRTASLGKAAFRRRAPLYHVTFSKSVPAILRDGLVPKTYPKLPPSQWEKGVYLTSKEGIPFWENILRDDMKWGGFHDQLSVLEVSPEGLELEYDRQGTGDSGAKAYITPRVPPENISVLRGPV
jgi:hypothetical protein